MNDSINIINTAAGILKAATPSELINRSNAIILEYKAIEKELSKISDEIAKSKAEALSNKAIDVNGVNVVSAMFSPMPAG